jgi:phage major head subunit gpT-like protein
MTTYANIEEGLSNASTTFDTLAKQLFGGSNLPGEYANYTYTQTGVTTSTTEKDVLANTPIMRKWVGPRREQRLRAYQQRIQLAPYEATLAIARMTLAYRDKQGQVADAIKQFLNNETVAYDLSVHAEYVSNSGAGPTGYDGVSLFSSSHPHAPASTGGTTQSNTNTLPFSAANLDAVIATMTSYRFENDTPMRIAPTHLRVGPKLARQAQAVIGTGVRLIAVNASGAEATSSVVAATGVENVYKGVLQLIVDPNLIGTMDDWWEVLDLSKGDAKPMQLLVGRAPEPVHQDQMWADRRFQLDEFVYGLEGDWVPAAGIWATAYRNIL